MGITKATVGAMLPDTLRRPQALAELDGERTIVAELAQHRWLRRGSAATGRTVDCVGNCRHRRTPTGATGQTACTSAVRR